jgi:hypothetical protein
MSKDKKTTENNANLIDVSGMKLAPVSAKVDTLFRKALPKGQYGFELTGKPEVFIGQSEKTKFLTGKNGAKVIFIDKENGSKHLRSTFVEDIEGIRLTSEAEGLTDKALLIKDGEKSFINPAFTFVSDGESLRIM